MASLKDVVRAVVFGYASGGLNLRTLPLANEEQGVYAVNVIDWPEKHRPASVVVLARVDGDRVIIEEDTTDRPLIDALINAGIPREQITQKIPEPAVTKK